LFGYVPKTNKLKVEAKGTDGLEGVKEELNEGKVLYAYVRYIIKNVPKFVYIPWCGPTVTGMLRGSFNNHAIEMANFIKVNFQNDRFIIFNDFQRIFFDVKFTRCSKNFTFLE
jgi:hypothetical protein